MVAVHRTGVPIDSVAVWAGVASADEARVSMGLLRT